MKNKMFYLLVLGQVVLLLILAGQYYLIDSYGATFKIYLDDSQDYSFLGNDRDVYVDYEIREIPQEKWGIEREISSRENVYVKLEVNKDGVFEVVDVADHKLTPYDTDQIILKAKYIYDFSGRYFVEYGLQDKIPVDYFVDVARDKPIVASFQRAPWGQVKLIKIENEN